MKYRTYWFYESKKALCSILQKEEFLGTVLSNLSTMEKAQCPPKAHI